MQYLLSQGANVNLCDYSNQTALHCATGYNREDMVEILLEKKANVNMLDDEKQAPLHYASGHGNSQIVSKLICRGANVKAGDINNQTALHFAAKGRCLDASDHVEVIRILLKNGADRTAKDNRQKKP
ncbi:ankyrin, partial [Hypoxylon sp. EC38]